MYMGKFLKANNSEMFLSATGYMDVN